MKFKSIISFFMILASAAMSYAQDWAKFGRYEDANGQIAVRPRAVFMGDSITDGWAQKDAEFFSDNNFVGRGISGQTTSHMLVRFRRDVIDLNPKYVVILAGTNDIARNNGEISLENIMGNIISMCELAKANRIPYVDYHSVLKDENNGLPAKYASDGVHPNMDRYEIMEDMICKHL